MQAQDFEQVMKATCLENLSRFRLVLTTELKFNWSMESFVIKSRVLFMILNWKVRPTILSTHFHCVKKKRLTKKKH